MEFNEFVRRPFKVEATRITEENIEEIAKMIGEVKTKGNEKFILLDKRIVPSMNRAYVGWWVTRFNDNLRCYSNKIFTEQFMPHTDEWNNWFAEDPTEIAVAEIDSIES
jgi:hypothetical protein